MSPMLLRLRSSARIWSTTQTTLLCLTLGYSETEKVLRVRHYANPEQHLSCVRILLQKCQWRLRLLEKLPPLDPRLLLCEPEMIKSRRQREERSMRTITNQKRQALEKIHRERRQNLYSRSNSGLRS